MSNELLRECRDELFRLGQDSATAYERGAFSEADKEAKEIHARIDAHLAKPSCEAILAELVACEDETRLTDQMLRSERYRAAWAAAREWKLKNG